MLVYLAKFTGCLSLFALFYKCFLEHQSTHNFKRYYLLVTIILSLVIPFYTITSYVAPVLNSPLSIQSSGLEMLGNPQLPIEAASVPINYWSIALWTVYGLGCLFFGIKFFINLFLMIRRIIKNPKERKTHFTLVMLEKKVEPHTFFHYIFYNRQKLESGEYPDEVFWHEEVHARQRHSIDVMLAECLQILFWFNPVVYLVRQSIKLNHEFLADRGVLRKGIPPNQYKETVLSYAIGEQDLAIATAFNYSFIKKRFKIMKTQTSKRSIFLRNLLIIPLLSLVLYSFSSREVIQRPAESTALTDEVGPVELVSTAASEQDALTEYNRLAKHYNGYPEYDFVTKAKDMWKIRHLYDGLSKEERESAEPYPKSPTWLTITITNDGRYLRDDKTQISLAEIEALFKQLTPEELSNAYAFSGEFDTGKYVRMRGEMNRSKLPPNDICILLRSREFVLGSVVNANVSEKQRKIFNKNGAKFSTAALLNIKLVEYVDELHTMFKKYGVKVDY